MSIAPHAAAGLFSLGMIIGSCWLIYVHFSAYAERIIDALLIGKDGDL